MDVALPADGARIPELFRDRVDRLHDVPVPRGHRRDSVEVAQRGGRQHCARPRPEILGGKVLAADLAKIAVHVARPDALAAAFAIQILEQRLTRQILAPLHAAGERRVREIDRLKVATLVKRGLPPGDLKVAAALVLALDERTAR